MGTQMCQDQGTMHPAGNQPAATTRAFDVSPPRTTQPRLGARACFTDGDDVGCQTSRAAGGEDRRHHVLAQRKPADPAEQSQLGRPNAAAAQHARPAVRTTTTTTTLRDGDGDGDCARTKPQQQHPAAVEPKRRPSQPPPPPPPRHWPRRRPRRRQHGRYHHSHHHITAIVTCPSAVPHPRPSRPAVALDIHGGSPPPPTTLPPPPPPPPGQRAPAARPRRRGLSRVPHHLAGSRPGAAHVPVAVRAQIPVCADARHGEPVRPVRARAVVAPDHCGGHDAAGGADAGRVQAVVPRVCGATCSG